MHLRREGREIERERERVKAFYRSVEREIEITGRSRRVSVVDGDTEVCGSIYNGFFFKRKEEEDDEGGGGGGGEAKKKECGEIDVCN